jgi:hypothetical protein
VKIMLRRIIFVLVLLMAVLAVLPFATSLAHSLRYQSAPSHRFHHSRAWWRRHRARMRRRQAMLALRARQLAAARRGLSDPATPVVSENHATLPAPLTLPANLVAAPAAVLPSGWSPAATRKDSETFRIASANGSQVAQATLSAIAATAPGANLPIGREAKRTLGNVSFTDLRRTVIDRMLSAGGWVINDMDREIGGHRVFQVVAQTPSASDGSAQTWNFYFTEIDGRLYSLTTHSAGEFNDKLSGDVEKFLSAFHPATK